MSDAAQSPQLASESGADTTSDPRLWLVAQLKPMGLRLALKNLRRQGLVPFSPWRWEMRRRKGKLKPVEQPLFPGYLFVGADPKTVSFGALNSTRGIARLVHLDPRGPAQVPSEFIDALQACCSETGEFSAPPVLTPGDTVRVRMGPFADLVGEIDMLASDDRVRVLVDLMGQTVRVVLPRGDLERQSIDRRV